MPGIGEETNRYLLLSHIGKVVPITPTPWVVCISQGEGHKIQSTMPALVSQ